MRCKSAQRLGHDKRPLRSTGSELRGVLVQVTHPRQVMREPVALMMPYWFEVKWSPFLKSGVKGSVILSSKDSETLTGMILGTCC